MKPGLSIKFGWWLLRKALGWCILIMGAFHAIQSWLF